MIKSNFKNLVEQIKKFSSAPPKPPAGYTPTRAPIPHNHEVMTYKIDKSIQDMQEAIYNLAQQISTGINFEKLQNPQTPGQTGKDPFSNFIVNNYLKESNAVLNVLHQVISQKYEQFVDGKWGNNTNRSLFSIILLVTSLVKMINELGLETNFDPKQIDELNNLIPNNVADINNQEKSERAPKITEIIKNIAQLFTSLKKTTLTNPEFRNFMEGKTNISATEKSQENQAKLTENEQNILSDLKQSGNQSKYNSTLNISINEKPYTISGANLLDSQAFNNWINQNKELAQLKQQNPTNFNNVVKLIFSQLKQQIDQKINGSAEVQI